MRRILNRQAHFWAVHAAGFLEATCQNLTKCARMLAFEQSIMPYLALVCMYLYASRSFDGIGGGLAKKTSSKQQ